MSDDRRSLKEIHDTLKSHRTPQTYDQWANTYDADIAVLEYKAPLITAEVLMKHLKSSSDQVRVLDVACGTGLVAKKLVSLGFHQFVGVDGSQAMLEKARGSGLYQDLHQALLGTQPLPAELEEFDVVLMVGALYKIFVPVEVVRELCQAAKPGGLVVITRANYRRSEEIPYTEGLHRELELMEEEGLWKRLEVAQFERYLADYDRPGQWFPGSVYVYQKTP